MDLALYWFWRLAISLAAFEVRGNLMGVKSVKRVEEVDGWVVLLEVVARGVSCVVVVRREEGPGGGEAVAAGALDGRPARRDVDGGAIARSGRCQ